MQEKYADSEKFTVVLSFAQLLDQEARDFLREQASGIPAYDRLNPPGAPCGTGIPDAYLFDHNGNLVRRGHPAELYSLVPGLVAAVPDPIPPSILGDFVPRALAAEARALEDPSVRAAKVVSKLEQLAGGVGELASEARELLDQVRGWMPREIERMEKIARRRPGFTAYHANNFAERFEGVDDELVSRAETLYKQLARDKWVKKLVRALADIDRGRAEENEKRGAQFLRRGRSALERLVGDSKAPSSIREEAREALQALP